MRIGSPYAECCGRLHRQTAVAETPEELMRSRYAAYVVGDLDHIFRTWHPRTRPDVIEPDPALTWTGLRSCPPRATRWSSWRPYERAGVPGRRHEGSRFEQRRDKWVYVDGDVS